VNPDFLLFVDLIEVGFDGSNAVARASSSNLGQTVAGIDEVRSI
jgi:hypothetical protein